MLRRFISGQFIEVIEWVDDSRNTLMYRFPVRGKEIKMGAQLTVRESQMAVFVNEGEVADVFSPGRHTLSTSNLPVLTKLKAWKYGFDSPFKAEVYFFNTKRFTEQKWGTTNPVMMRDQDFGMVRFRAFGIYGYRLVDPKTIITELAGTNERYTTDDLEKHLRNIIVSGLSDAVASSHIPVMDLSTKYDELSAYCLERFNKRFNNYGLEMTAFVISNISFPKEVEEAIDKRTSMGAIGDLGRYTQYQAAEAMRDAAKNEGGVAGTGVGFGAGVGMAGMMTQAFHGTQQKQGEQQAQGSQQTPGTGQPEAEQQCSKCLAMFSASAKFCPECGSKANAEVSPKITCPHCSAEMPAGAKFCMECGKQPKVLCEKCGHELEGNGKFCPECGHPRGEE